MSITEFTDATIILFGHMSFSLIHNNCLLLLGCHCHLLSQGQQRQDTKELEEERRKRCASFEHIQFVGAEWKLVKSSIKTAWFCLKLICGSLHCRNLKRSWYPENHLMVKKLYGQYQCRRKKKYGEQDPSCAWAILRSWQCLPDKLYCKAPTFLVGELGASVHCTNDWCRGSNICKGSGTGTIGAHCEAMTASSMMDVAGTFCNKFNKKQLKATLKDVQYNPKSNFNLFKFWQSYQRRLEAQWWKRWFGTDKGQCKARLWYQINDQKYCNFLCISAERTLKHCCTG